MRHFLKLMSVGHPVVVKLRSGQVGAAFVRKLKRNSLAGNLITHIQGEIILKLQYRVQIKYCTPHNTKYGLF